ncbi:integrase [Pseudomonas sp. Sample_22]|uniref:integrase n=1 Tax=Pseudomonas sp. Sample_22 TaxID=2448266 RepID=UPI001032C68C|nr:integrase [Pseudomonas sp. Sample_22]
MSMSAYALTTVQFTKVGGIKLKLVAINGQIDLFAGAYALQRFENGLRINSIKADQTVILHLYRFCEINAIELIQRIADQKPLKIGEIEAFSSFCCCTRSTGVPVNAAWYAARMRGAMAFIHYLWSFYQDNLQADCAALQSALLRYQRMKAGFDLYAKSPYKSDRQDKIGLAPALQAKFISIIDPSPSNKLNPWKTSKVRWRNCALLLLLMLGGNRKGETLLLKLNHFQLSGHRKYYDIFKVGPVADYPRSEVPSVKTLGRQIELHEDLANLIEYYITQVRVLFTGWKSTSYLFISYRDGLPLSLQTPNAILNELTRKHPEFKGLLSPHRLRNTFHDLLDTALDLKFKDQSPLSRTLLKSPIQEAAGGWVRNSQMPERYAKGSIQRKVRASQVLIQQQAFHAFKAGVE